MFRSLGGALKNKELQLKKEGEQSLSLDSVVRGYTQKAFGQEVSGWKLLYNEKNHQLTIQTNSKALASELLMRRDDILDLFDQSRITVSRLIIR